MTSAQVVNAFNLEAAQSYNRALDLYIKGNTTEAIKEFENAVNLDPEFADAFYNLGSIYRYTNQLDKAEEAFLKVHTLKPDEVSIFYDLGLVYIQKNDYNRALKYLKMIVKESDKYYEAQSKISMLENEMKSLNITYNPNITLENNTKVASKTEPKTPKVQETKQIAKETPDNNILTPIIDPNNKLKSTPKEKKVEKSKPEKQKRKLTKKDRTEISQTLADNSFIGNETNSESSVQTIAQNITPQEPQIQKKDNYWDKYNSTSKPKNTTENSNIVDDKVAVNYMTIEDTSVSGKLTLSPKNNLVKNSPQPCVKESNTIRTAVKTFASGFNGPTGIVRDSLGYFYVANYSENKIYKVSPTGDKTLFACSDDINGPLGLAIDRDGYLYVANYLSDSITRITPSGDTATIATGLNKPYFIYIDEEGKLYVTEQDSNTISEVNLNLRKGYNR